MMPLAGKPMIVYQLQRLRRCECLDGLILATSDDSSDDDLAELVAAEGFSVFRGSLDDVLERFRSLNSQFNAKTIVRLTGDCPLSDPNLVDELAGAFHDGSWDYLANCADQNQLSVPDGFDVEVFKAELLERAALEAKLPSEREHVTPWMRSKAADLRWGHFKHQPMRPYYRVTVDEPVDFEVVAYCGCLHPNNSNFGVDDVVGHLNHNPTLAARNLATVRNEGFLKSLDKDAAFFATATIW